MRVLALNFILFAVCQIVSAQELGVYKPLRDGTQDLLRLQDFAIFRSGNYIYTAPMMKDFSNQGILVARSTDYQNWDTRGKAVTVRTPECSSMVWAPDVVEDNGVYYMFYTGVTQPGPGLWCQRILVASTTDPGNPSSWQRNYNVQFMVDGQAQSWFRPSHPGHVWSANTWADCRDAMVLKHKGTWYMFYSGADVGGGICGVATAPSVLGPWTDHGAVLKLSTGIPESCYVLEAPDGSFVMTMNHAGGAPDGGHKIASATSLVPVDGQPSFGNLRLLTDVGEHYLTGWAHEFIPEEDGTLLAANLTGYWVNFKKAYFTGRNGHWEIVEKAPRGTVSEAKDWQNNALVNLKGMVVSAVFASDGVFYIQDDERTGGLRVVGSTTGLEVGTRVDVVGRMGTRMQSGKPAERQLTATKITIREQDAPPKPLQMQNLSIGGEPRPPFLPGVMNGVGTNNMGLLARVTGKVTSISSYLFWLDDGSGLVETAGRTGIMVRATMPVPGLAVGDMVSVTGIIEGNIPFNAPTNRRVVRPRSLGDIVRE